jgi:ATP-dependent DNA helicase PIF1
MTLNQKQQEAYELMCSKESILLTSMAGTGKSFLINYFVDKHKLERNIGVTSTTGISSLAINGKTLHSYLGIGLAKESTIDLAQKIRSKATIRAVWKKTETLIIDEISMMSPELFTKLETIARIVREDVRPFGGIQLILVGDFLQLPVVGTDKLCFESPVWNKCITKVVTLNEIVRQKDVKFQECLNEVRLNNLSQESITLLKTLNNRVLDVSGDIKPTYVYTTNANVDEMNDIEFKKILTQENDVRKYEMDFDYTHPHKPHYYTPDFIARSKKNCNAPISVSLCVGAQVILLVNLDCENKLVNGSRGVVTSFIENIPVVRFCNGVETLISHSCWEYEVDGKKDEEIRMFIQQIPLKLAWALTVHKLQGSTIDFAIVDLNNVFVFGQVYVALSRCKNIEGLSIRGLNIQSISAHPKAIEFYNKHAI